MLFRETTATFLDELVPVDVLRDLRDEPSGELAKYGRVVAGAQAISVGFGPVSDPDSTVIGGEHDLGRSV